MVKGPKLTELIGPNALLKTLDIFKKHARGENESSFALVLLSSILLRVVNYYHYTPYYAIWYRRLTCGAIISTYDTP